MMRIEDDDNDNEDSDEYCNAMMMMGSAEIESADGASSYLVLCQYGPTTFCCDYPYQLIPVSFAFHSSAVSNLCSHL